MSVEPPFLPGLSAFKSYQGKNLVRSVAFASRIVTLPLFPTLTLYYEEEICGHIGHGSR